MASLCVRVAVFVGLLASLAQPAQAQSFLQSIFGYGAQAPRSPYRLPYGNPYQPSWGGDEGQHLDRGGTYRTLCVRLCDGFYFPVSSAATQSSFARDADACSASCGAEARLFHHPNVGGDVDTMVDLTGMAYSALPNAFKYRQTLVPSCRCRPQPWSETELQRHRAYAQGHAPDSPGPPRVVGIDSPTPAADDPRAVPRPPPIVREDQPVWAYPSSGNAGPPKSRYIWPYRY
jgi:hypothetical protein